jgi:histidinol-phosphate aminotransferase
VTQLKSYPETALPCMIKMDANENEWGLPPEVKSLILKDMHNFPFHRYPDSEGVKLREEFSKYIGVPAKNLMIGNGSDELIRYIVDTFISQGDRVVIPAPAFSMYGFFVNLAGGDVVSIEPDEDLRVDAEKVAKAAAAENAKIVFLCCPNNPTGGALSFEEIKTVIEQSQCVVVVDEAYYEFYGSTVIDWVKTYPNLIVLRTLSKAAGLAGLRVGFLAAGDAIMNYLSRVKVPYNVGSFSQLAALRVLENRQALDAWLDIFKKVREDFVEDLRRIEGIRVFPTQANFVLIRMDNARLVWQGLLEKGILTRKFDGGVLSDCLRVTVCPPHQNSIFIEELKKTLGEVCR